jgi:hypothetical protein
MRLVESASLPKFTPAKIAFQARRRSRWFLSFLLFAGLTLRAGAQTDMIIYNDSIQNSWNDWSYKVTLDFNSTAVVHSGSKAIAVSLNTGTNYGALSLEHADINSSLYTSLTFWINGGPTGGQRLQVYAELTNASMPAVMLSTLQSNTWQQITLSLASLGVANQPDFHRFSIQDISGLTNVPTYYVDDISLIANTNPPPIVTLTSPANGASYAAPASISLAATVVTNAHTITKVQFYNGTNLLNEDTTVPYAFTWTNVSLGNYSLLARVIYDTNSSIDSAPAAVSVTGTSSATITVDAQANRHAISPLIYGTAFAGSSNQLSDLNAPLNRSGGNNETRYNWQLNAHNIDADWYFESVSDGPTSAPGSAADDFVKTSKNGGAEPMITIPMIGWTAKLGPSRSTLASYTFAKYGPQMSYDPYNTNNGNGIASPSKVAITNNDPNDANSPCDVTFQQGYVQHLMNTWGASTNGGVRYYFMDNEHSIWFSTHQDIHPVGPTMQEIRDDMINYAGMVKSNDPGAIVCGPEEWGWGGYFFSGYDQQNSGNHDRIANGNMDYMPWLLQQLHQHDTGTGTRLLDYFTLHCYPQAGEFGNDVSTSMELLRNTSTRQFWDSNYVDESWIGQQAPGYNILQLIPRMKNWVAVYYPGTKIGITEYNWGAEGYINGATAQADVLGIFGREGLDMATRWTTPTNGSLVYNSMKMYRNYDGNKSTFGDTSVYAGGPNPDNVSTFAAVRSSDGALTVLVVNKQLIANSAITMNISNFANTGIAHVWQLTSANTINHLSDVAVSGNSLSTTVPLQSITLFVLLAATVTPPPSPVLTNASMSDPSTFSFTLANGVAGQSYVILSSTDLVNWSPVQTNTLTGTSTNLSFAVPDALHFYQVQWAAP